MGVRAVGRYFGRAVGNQMLSREPIVIRESTRTGASGIWFKRSAGLGPGPQKVPQIFSPTKHGSHGAVYRWGLPGSTTWHSRSERASIDPFLPGEHGKERSQTWSSKARDPRDAGEVRSWNRQMPDGREGSRAGSMRT